MISIAVVYRLVYVGVIVPADFTVGVSVDVLADVFDVLVAVLADFLLADVDVRPDVPVLVDFLGVPIIR